MFAAVFMFPSTGRVQGVARLDDGEWADQFATEKEAWEFVSRVLVAERGYAETIVGVVPTMQAYQQ